MGLFGEWFIKFPFFMKRKKKIEVLEAMLESIKESNKKTKCDICKKKFTKNMLKYSLDNFSSCVCYKCNRKYFKKLELM